MTETAEQTLAKIKTYVETLRKDDPPDYGATGNYDDSYDLGYGEREISIARRLRELLGVTIEEQA